jgi:ATP-dependent DNA ligase
MSSVPVGDAEDSFHSRAQRMASRTSTCCGPALARSCREAFLYAFDLLELDGTDLRRQPWEARRARLASLLRRHEWTDRIGPGAARIGSR